MVPVKLPKEVLDLFPKWEYRCPSCSTYVKQESSFCPNCKSVFDKKTWRVPPRFLENQDTMSEYAHSVLAPKLSSEQRKLLFRYFTELFTEDFETADFSKWDAESESGAAISIVSDYVHHGKCSAYVSGVQGGGEYAYVRKSIGNYDELYLRYYIRFETLPDTNNHWKMGAMLGKATSNDVTVPIRNFYTEKWGIQTRATSGSWTSTYETGTSQFSAETWYCVELKQFSHDTNGSIVLWVDEEEILEITGYTNEWGQLNTIMIGERWNDSAQTADRNYWIDCVVVADTYVGPESSEQTYTKTWSTDALFKKLGAPKTVDIDVALQKQDVLKSFGLDSAFQRSFSVQKAVDAFFKRFDLQKNFSLDACFGGLVTNVLSRQINAVFKALDVAKSFGLDVYFGALEAETNLASFGLNCVFAYKVRLPELWLDENGKLVFNISKPYAWVGI